MISLAETVTVVNAEGVHARPATMISRLVMASGCEVTFRHASAEADGASVLELLILGIPGGAVVQVEVRGPHADACLRGLQDLFASGFSAIYTGGNPHRRSDPRAGGAWV
jgi:phosphotransferase system HPr (HPr) family protein